MNLLKKILWVFVLAVGPFTVSAQQLTPVQIQEQVKSIDQEIKDCQDEIKRLQVHIDELEDDQLRMQFRDEGLLETRRDLERIDVLKEKQSRLKNKIEELKYQKEVLLKQSN